MSAASRTTLRTGRGLGLALAAVVATGIAGFAAVPAIAGTPPNSGGTLAPSYSPLNGGSLAPTPGPPAVPVGARDVQRRLVALRYLPPEALSGRWDYRTAQALTAFQAWQGLDRDGVPGPRTVTALRNATVPKATRPTRGRSIEVYRSKGVTLLIEGMQVVRAIHSSSGRAGYSTPAGSFRVFRKEANSWSYPYRIWLPYASYFNAGIAFHAYTSVPAYAASHGCIRVSAPEAPFLYAFATIGTPVTVY